MKREVQVYVPPPHERQQDAYQEAYRTGMAIARRAGQEVALPVNGEDPFDHPFFKQGQVQRTQTQRRTVHVINEQEYILTEETTTVEVRSFGDDIFGR